MANVTTLAIGGTANVGTGFTSGFEYYAHMVDLATAVAAGLATTQKIRIVNIPANTAFQLLQVEIVDALGSAVTRIDVGDSAADTTYVNNQTTVTAGTDSTIATASKYYGAADTIELKITGTTLTSGTVRFIFGLLDCSAIAAGKAPSL